MSSTVISPLTTSTSAPFLSVFAVTDTFTPANSKRLLFGINTVKLEPSPLLPHPKLRGIFTINSVLSPLVLSSNPSALSSSSPETLNSFLSQPVMFTSPRWFSIKIVPPLGTSICLSIFSPAKTLSGSRLSPSKIAFMLFPYICCQRGACTLLIKSSCCW